VFFPHFNWLFGAVFFFNGSLVRVSFSSPGWLSAQQLEFNNFNASIFVFCRSSPPLVTSTVYVPNRDFSNLYFKRVGLTLPGRHTSSFACLITARS